MLTPSKSVRRPSPSAYVRTLPCPLASLLPPKHRQALTKYLKTFPETYRVAGGRGALKTSFAVTLSTVLLQSESPHGDILFLTASRSLARHAFDYFDWLFTQRFPTAYVSPNGSWRMESSPSDGLLSLCFHGELKDAQTGLPTFHYHRRIHFLPLDHVKAVRRFLAKTDYSLIIAEDAETLDLDLIREFRKGKPNVRTVFLYNAYSSTSAHFSYPHPDYAPYFRKVRPSVRFTYKDVPVKYLGKHFFCEAALLRKINRNAYRTEYLALAPLRKRKHFIVSKHPKHPFNRVMDQCYRTLSHPPTTIVPKPTNIAKITPKKNPKKTHKATPSKRRR